MKHAVFGVHAGSGAGKVEGPRVEGEREEDAAPAAAQERTEEG